MSEKIVEKEKLTILSLDPVFGKNTPEQIASAFDLGCAPDTWKVGDEIIMTLKNGEELVMVLADTKNRYNYADTEGVNSHVLCCKGLLVENMMMNSKNKTYVTPSGQTITGYNAGGWGHSELRDYLNSTFFEEMIPDEWKKCIATVKIPYMNGGSQSGVSLEFSDDKIFILNHKEIYGNSPSGWEAQANKDSESQFELYDWDHKRVDLDNYSGAIKEGHWYWCRGCYSNNVYNFLGVNSVGGANGNSATSSYGVSPCLCLSLKH